MTVIARTIVVAVFALTWLVSGVGTAAAHTALAGSDPLDGAAVETVPSFANDVFYGAGGRNWAPGPPTGAAPPTTSGPLGSDTKGTVITAAVAGLLLGAAIAFWQSRRHRRKDEFPDEPPSP